MVQNGDYSRTFAEYNLDGTIKQITEANGAITYYSYDALGNKTNEWKPVSIIDGITMYSWTAYTYNKAGNLTTEKTGKSLVLLNSTTDDVYSKTYTYNDGLMKQFSDSEGRKTIYTYDGDGQVRLTEESVSVSKVQITASEYNYLGKQTSVTTKVRTGDLTGNGYDNEGYTDVVNIYSYDLNGNLTTSADAAGNVTSYTYDKLNRVLSATKQLKNADGTVINAITSKAYTWDGKTAIETDANGNVTIYTYDAYGNQTQITDALGNVTLKYYDRAGNNTAIVAPKNYIPGVALSAMEHTEFTYDTMGRVIKQTEVYQKMNLDSNYQWTKEPVRISSKTLKYDTLGNVISTTDALGNTSESTYNLAGLLETTTDAETKAQSLPYAVKYNYNGLAQKVKETYQGAICNYSYDGTGNLLQTIINGVVKSSTSYDYLGRAISITDGRGNTTTQTWNAMNKISQTNTPGDLAIAANRTIYQYDLLGNLTYSKDSMGKVNTYTYDSLGRNLSRTIQDEAGQQKITTFSTYDLNGNALTQTDGNGNNMVTTYDKLNRALTTTNALNQTTTYFYDANGNLLTETNYLGNTTVKVYDGINRLVEVRDAYDNVVQQILYNDANAQTSSYDALHSRTQFLYDRNLRQAGTIDAEGNTTAITYDSRGNISTKADGNGNTITYKYDGENRLISVKDALGNKTSYTYDAAGNLTSQTDGNGNATTYQYNVANLVTAKIDPSSSGYANKAESYTYYANGLTATKTDRNGITTASTYDIFGRLTSEDAGGEVQSYTYDANGNILTMADSTGTTTRTYDVLNRNNSKTVPEIGISIYEYDLPAEEGRYSERTTDPKGNVTLNTYDKVGRLCSVTVGKKTTVYEYYANGNRSRIIYPDGTTENYFYDRKNQVTSLINKKANGTVISSYTYTYDAAGNQLTKSEEKGTTTYTYDRLNRLVSVSEPTGKVTSYTYDRAGNRKTEKIQSGLTAGDIVYNYDIQNRLISTVSTGGAYTRYYYDSNGNLVSKTSGTIEAISTDNLTAEDLPNFGLIIKRDTETGTGSGNLTLYTYDHYNRLTTMKADKTAAAYQYNAQGYRVKKSVNGKTTKYLYNADKVVLETDGTGKQTAFQAYGSNLLYRDVAASGEQGAQSYYYLYNAHGDVTGLIDAVGNVAATYDYDAFGNMLSQTGTADNHIKYAGYQSDDESGLYYLNARYYDSVIARFISEDSYTGQQNDPLTLNLYTYVQNNPIRYTDPSGHKSTVVDYGDKGTEVKAIQIKLKSEGYYTGKLDGKFGPATLQAVKDYQEAHRLKVDGKVGEKTKYSMYGVNSDSAQSSGTLINGAYVPNNIAVNIKPASNKKVSNSQKATGGKPSINPAKASNTPQSTKTQGTGNGYELWAAKENEVNVAISGYPSINPIFAVPLGIVESTGMCDILFSGVVNECINDVIDYNKENTYEFAERYKVGKVVGVECSVASIAVGVANSAVAINSVDDIAKGAAYFKGGSQAVSNALPENGRFATVMPKKFAEQLAIGEGKLSGGTEAWITAADDLSGINTVKGAANRLTLIDETGNLRLQGDAVVEFELNDLSGIASPYNRLNPGYLKGGKTGGDAREWLIPSDTQINNVKIRNLTK